ncbi:MAG TPA: FAD-dependent oxidoreductase [Acidimicrobiales bacterium]
MRAGFHSAFRSGFRRAMGTSSLARATGAPLDEAAAAVRQARIDRRSFLAGATAAGILAAAPSTRPESAGAAARSGSHPRVVIVGAGLAASWEAGPRIAWYADGTVDEHLGGSYSYYRVGQATGFGGIEGTPEGNLHFAGEHTSQAYKGFMEGAVTSGERAAREIPS